jgi:hypothetical protein
MTSSNVEANSGIFNAFTGTGHIHDQLMTKGILRFSDEMYDPRGVQQKQGKNETQRDAS